jgi:hypothetical protein
MTDTVVTSALARTMLDDSTGLYREYEDHHIPMVRMFEPIYFAISRRLNLTSTQHCLDLADEGGWSSLNGRI